MKARPTFEKRRKEMARKDKKKDKAEKRLQRKEDRANKPDRADMAEDPDIAGITWGPQPDPDDAEAIERAEAKRAEALNELLGEESSGATRGPEEHSESASDDSR